MGAQIRFFKKNLIDLANEDASITVTDATATSTGQTFINYLRNRNNTSAWMTTGSNDAANTQLDIDLGVERDITDILLIKNNFKAYTLKYYNGATYVDFPTAIAETTNALDTKHHEFASTSAKLLRLIITGTMVADADKRLFQLIVTEKKSGSGVLEGWPIIKNPLHDSNKKTSVMLSGKTNLVEGTGAFKVDLEVGNWKIQTDIDIVESIYFGREATLVWLGGGDESQFGVLPQGYRKEDIYLMRPVNSYEPEFFKNYTTGLKILMKLQECI